MIDRFVKLSHLVEDGQQVIMRVSDDGKGDVTQFLEYFDNDWHAVAGIMSGIPISMDVVRLVAQRQWVHEIRHKTIRWDKETNERIETMEPLDPMDYDRYKPELTIVVSSPRGPTQLKYERVEPPDCDAIKLFGSSTLAEGYLIAEDESDPLLDALWEGADSNAKLKANYERMLADGRFPKDEVENAYRTATALCDLDSKNDCKCGKPITSSDTEKYQQAMGIGIPLMCSECSGGYYNSEKH